MDILRNSIDQLSETFKIAGLALQDLKDEEVAKFEAALRGGREEDGATSVTLIESFSREKKRVFLEVTAAGFSGARADPQIAALTAPLSIKLDALYDSLMDLEMRQVQKFDSMLGDFEEAFGELKAQCSDLTANYFKSVQEAEEKYFTDVTALANTLLDSVGKEDAADTHSSAAGLSEEAAGLLADRDVLMASIGGSHDVHVTKGFNAETRCEEKEKSTFVALVTGRRDEARGRNRGRVGEICGFVEEVRGEIEGIMEEEGGDEDDDYEL